MCSTMIQQAEKKGGYDGSRLSKSIANLVAPLEQKEKDIKLSKDLGQLHKRVEQRPILTSTKTPVIVPKASKVGFSKITVTITEQMALQILNYAGHSSKKAATIDVFYAQHKPSQVENALPVYPLAELYKSSVQ